MVPRRDPQSALRQDIPRPLITTPGARRIVSLLLLFLITLGSWCPAASAEGSDSRMATIAKDTLYGGLIGLVLGGTLTLVVDEDKRDDVVRWGVVIGVFGGFVFGIYEASDSDDLLSGFTTPLDAPAGRERVRSGQWGPLASRLDPLLHGEQHHYGDLPSGAPLGQGSASGGYAAP